MEKVIIYTQQGCKQSDKLKMLLNTQGTRFIEKDITCNVLLKREMIERTGGRSVTPQAFVDGKYIPNIDAWQSGMKAPIKRGKKAA